MGIDCKTGENLAVLCQGGRCRITVLKNGGEVFSGETDGNGELRLYLAPFFEYRVTAQRTDGMLALCRWVRVREKRQMLFFVFERCCLPPPIPEPEAVCSFTARISDGAFADFPIEGEITAWPRRLI